jgi:WhiB family transcriptional regulator, redox-sensing transcriptional regulator
VDFQGTKEVTVMRRETPTARAAVDRPRSGGTAARRGIREWRQFAACGGVGGLFYKADVDSSSQNQHRVTRAKAICHQCPVRPECAAHALAVGEPYGIWGGFTEVERARLALADWRRYADRQCRWVDVTELDARLRAFRVEERHSMMFPPPG